MKVILLDYVYKQGVAGEVIDVADGYARNFLIPKRLAVKATAGELKRASKLREQASAKRAALENRMNELARLINGVELVFGRRAAATGKLFGSVTTQEIADELMRVTGVDINRRRISQQPLREIGIHDVPVRLGTEISPVLKIAIVREDELAAYVANRKAEAVGEVVEAVSDDQPEQPAQPEDATEMQTEVLPHSVIQEALKTARKAAEEAKEAAEEAEEEPAQGDESAN